MRAPAATVEALAYQLRGGVEALRDLDARRRLSELNEAQMREIADRLTKWRWGISKDGEMPPKVPPWTPDEIEAFAKLWRNHHDNQS
jgi:hypothetical protein